MSLEVMRTFRFFFPWQDEDEETWLREMSQTGWHMESVRLPGIYTFRRGEPMDYVYRLDYRTTPRREFLSYLQLFSDAGWDYLDEMNNWQYFRKLAKPGDDPQIYTDAESKIAKYRRVLTSMGLASPAPFVAFFIIVANGIKHDRYPMGVGVMFLAIIFIMAILYGVVFVKITERINQLKRA